MSCPTLRIASANVACGQVSGLCLSRSDRPKQAPIEALATPIAKVKKGDVQLC